MPIGVPRIIYCWGEELPAQWTDIYNFIFRRRMVFLMQYLDDELCNQICGLLINIHMEDRSKELEKKEMENSGLFKSSQKKPSRSPSPGDSSPSNFAGNSLINDSQFKKKERSVEDLMISEEDLAIDENYRLERDTLQKISLEWLNWNAQFFDYSDEPYLFYLAELLAQDVTGDNAGLLYNLKNSFESSNNNEFSKLMTLFKLFSNKDILNKKNLNDTKLNNAFDIYSPFRFLSNLSSLSIKDINMSYNNKNFLTKLQQLQNQTSLGTNYSEGISESNISSSLLSFASAEPKQRSEEAKEKLHKFQSYKAQNEFFSKMQEKQVQLSNTEKAFTQRQLRRDYTQEMSFKGNAPFAKRRSESNYLNLNNYNYETTEANYREYRDYYRKQTERSLQDEESKKVFMVINSFGGSVGNGITVHDALQFIKAGSMTLALGVAASAASLALAGGTIGERYVTEGCHVMIHQPESAITGQASDIWIDSLEIMKIRLDVAEIYSLSTYRPRHKILRDLDRDFYLTATEAVYYGLADEIATNEVLQDIMEMTSKVWDYHDSQQQKLLESRESATAGLDTQTQN
uniref:ATP-dependent Clp protease proteolytic subunit n=1 Tax=Lacunastrum gracillimum TaxID=427913 RepID=A0A2U8GH34_9CHLO|nr:proteolytic subunit 2 of clp protease [Lacunastrum gracillimum]AWI68025.1 proteolytic subunit 2 of clp protease [Lacunastrum gracillimum]